MSRCTLRDFCGTLKRGEIRPSRLQRLGRAAGGVRRSSLSRFIPVVDIPKTRKQKAASRGLLSIRSEERLGSLLAAGGTAWLVYAATVDFNHLGQMRIMPAGPVEACAVGILMWLHAKWRRSIKVD